MHRGAPSHPRRRSVGALCALGVPGKHGVGTGSGAQPHLGALPLATGAPPGKNLRAKMSNGARSSLKPRGGEEVVITP